MWVGAQETPGTPGAEWRSELLPESHAYAGRVERALNVGMTVTCIDVCPSASLLAVGVGKICLCFRLPDLKQICQFGKLVGTIHKGRVLACAIHPYGSFVATCGEDKRVVLWSVVEAKCDKVLEGHAAEAQCAAFAPGAATGRPTGVGEAFELLVTGGADGAILVWDWQRGTLLQKLGGRPSGGYPCRLHVHAPRRRLTVAVSDGSCEVWDLGQRRLLGAVPPGKLGRPAAERPFTPSENVEDPGHHASVNDACLSADGRWLATASADASCGLWQAASFARDYAAEEQPPAELPLAASDRVRIANQYDDRFEAAPPAVEGVRAALAPGRRAAGGVAAVAGAGSWGAMPEDRPLQVGRRAYYERSLIHDGPVSRCLFLHDADRLLLATAAGDSTVRLWDPGTGNPLFQVNLPAPAADLWAGPAPVVGAEEGAPPRTLLFIACATRVLVVSFRRRPPGARRRAQRRRRRGASVEPAGREAFGGGLALRKGDVVRMIAHGSLAPQYLAGVLARAHGVSVAKLYANMREAGVGPHQVLRAAMSGGGYRPADILRELAAERPERARPLFTRIAAGLPISPEMLARGYIEDTSARAEEAAVVQLSEEDASLCYCYTVVPRVGGGGGGGGGGGVAAAAGRSAPARAQAPPLLSSLRIGPGAGGPATFRSAQSPRGRVFPAPARPAQARPAQPDLIRRGVVLGPSASPRRRDGPAGAGRPLGSLPPRAADDGQLAHGQQLSSRRRQEREESSGGSSSSSSGESSDYGDEDLWSPSKAPPGHPAASPRAPGPAAISRNPFGGLRGLHVWFGGAGAGSAAGPAPSVGPVASRKALLRPGEDAGAGTGGRRLVLAGRLRETRAADARAL
eukprot:tig00000293_g23889.t1